MKVLILGGTGAMGTPLQKYLDSFGYDVFVTSRSKRESGPVSFLQGNAHDFSFLKDILKRHFDVIVDFMAYKTREFEERAATVLESTGQYIFISSSRVYAPCDSLITENSPRLLDVCGDADYLRTDEYALTKARQEDILRACGNQNWTIVRPSLTYNTNRLQNAIGEKEEWLYRFLNQEKIVFPRNLNDVVTTMSFGDDVAHALALLTGNGKALGEAVHIAGAKPVTWAEVNRIYEGVLKARFHRAPDMEYIDSWETIGRTLGRFYQLKYARAVSRRFDQSKLNSIVGPLDFLPPQAGLSSCLNRFLDGDMAFRRISWKSEACYNRITGDKNRAFRGREKLKYLVGLYTPYFKLSR